jgi:ribosomal subunit interface protein
MRLQISARHCEVPDAVRKRVEERVPRLKKYDPRLAAAEVIFTEERHMKRVEGILSIDGGEPIVASGEDAEFMAAVERMADRLGRALRRRRSQIRKHKGRGPGEEWGLEADT